MDDPIIEVREPGRQPLRLVLTDSLVVGRECEGLLLADHQTSRRHLELRNVAGHVELTDLGSSNGTFVNGEATVGARLIAPDDRVQLGMSTIVVVGEPPQHDPRATHVTSNPIGRMTSIDHVAELVAADSAQRPSLERDEGTITIVFSDIEGSTERVTRAGDDEWVAVLARHNAIVRASVSRHQGRVVKSQGDGFMLTFRSARRAAKSMIEVQTTLGLDPITFDERPLRIRVGMHTGEVIVDDEGDLFGMHVHYAARIAGHAAGGEILVSEVTRAMLQTRSDMSFAEPRRVELKGIPGDHVAHALRV